MNYFTDIVGEVAEATNCNDHTGSLIIIAEQVLFDFELSGKLNDIEAEADRVGYLDTLQYAMRQGLYRNIMASCKAQLTEVQYEDLHGAL